MVVCYAVMIVLLSALLLINMRENKRRDKIAAERGYPEETANLEFSDLTDFENPNFRYTLYGSHFRDSFYKWIYINIKFLY